MKANDSLFRQAFQAISEGDTCPHSDSAIYRDSAIFSRRVIRHSNLLVMN